MPNSGLLFAAAALTVAAVWVMVRRNSVVAPAVAMASIMLVTALGGPIWEWSKQSGGAGLPPGVLAQSFESSLATQAFLWASIGAALAAFLVPRVPTALAGNEGAWAPSPRAKLALLMISVAGFIAWLVGQGSTILDREYYGQFDGNEFVVRATFPLALIIGVVMLGISTTEEKKAVLWCTYTISAAWFVVLTSTGSRTALIFPLLGAVLMVRSSFRSRRLSVFPLVGASGLVVLAILSFAVVLQVRSMPHGILNMPTVISTVVDNAMSSTDSYLLPAKQLLASIFASHPIAEQSVRYEVGLDVLLGNANILPGTAQPMELERYWPYEWVPLSFAGCWFGATGWMGQVGLFGFMSWLSCYTSYNFQRGKYSFLTFLPLMLTLIVAVLSIQYSSRMVWRVFSVIVFLCVVAYLTRERVKKPVIDMLSVPNDAAAPRPLALQTAR
jgi:hypothetical protein